LLLAPLRCHIIVAQPRYRWRMSELGQKETLLIAGPDSAEPQVPTPSAETP
jgi:hypothetical protein